MKQHKIIIYLIFFVFGSLGLYAQTVISQDSVLSLRVHRMKGIYSLTPSQEASFLSIERRFKKSLDSIDRIQLSLEQRKQWLTSELEAHDRQIKSILNDVQWGKYLGVLKSGHASFVKQSGVNETQVQDVPRRNF